jgi:hypothetical protein
MKVYKMNKRGIGKVEKGEGRKGENREVREVGGRG